jgi:hypothetical protein
MEFISHMQVRYGTSRHDSRVPARPSPYLLNQFRSSAKGLNAGGQCGQGWRDGGMPHIPRRFLYIVASIHSAAEAGGALAQPIALTHGASPNLPNSDNTQLFLPESSVDLP